MSNDKNVMVCDTCGAHRSKVIDSRDGTVGRRRRRQCMKCGYRWTTYELKEAGFGELLREVERNRSIVNTVERMVNLLAQRSDAPTEAFLKEYQRGQRSKRSKRKLRSVEITPGHVLPANIPLK